MALRLKCKCGRRIQVPARLAGKKLACPQCKRPFRISAEKFKAADARRKKPATPAPDPEPASLDQQLIEEASGHIALTPSDLLNEMDRTEAGSIHDVGSQVIEPTESPSATPAGGPVCPSCETAIGVGNSICVKCGINVKSGRSLITSDEGHLDSTYIATEQTIRWISWVFGIGFYPFASEAFGTRKPWAIRGIAVFTIFTSLWFLIYDWSGSPSMQSAKDMMLWCGDGEPDAEHLYMLYLFTDYGDTVAFNIKLEQLEMQKAWEEDQARNATTQASGGKPLQTAPPPIPPDLADLLNMPGFDEELVLEAHNALAPEQQCIGQFHWYQLLTNIFLHGGILHLLGNLLLLMVFGSRVNALIGDTYTLILYPLLGIAGSLAHLISAAAGQPIPALGASGAIMGLAGIYLVMFPIHKVHMAAWIRWGLFFAFRLSLRIFQVRGFWVVLFYIAMDIFFTMLGSDDGVAHWAHIGGFVAGVFFALLLLISRQINARGGDVLSAVLGKHAWALIGKPRA